MKEKIHNPQPLVLQEGYFIDYKYAGYDELVGCSDNWEHHCTYQLLPNGLTGHHQVLQLNSMQVACVERPGGMMNDVVTAKNCLTFVVIEENEDKICFDRVKLQTGDILFFDDSKAFSFMSNAHIKFCVVNMQKEYMGTLKVKMIKSLFHIIKDRDNMMSKTLRNIWKELTSTDNQKKTKTLKDSELKIVMVMNQLLREQTPLRPKITRGEGIALDIRDQVYQHMDGKVSIESLAKQFQVSEKTLQNSFKSLFGFTPKKFLQLLKLNHVHYELKQLTPKESTVSKVAQKWGFSHMGQFTRYYTNLFNENPSQTLKTLCHQEKGMDISCVIRKEEM